MREKHEHNTHAPDDHPEDEALQAIVVPLIVEECEIEHEEKITDSDDLQDIHTLRFSIVHKKVWVGQHGKQIPDQTPPQ